MPLTTQVCLYRQSGRGIQVPRFSLLLQGEKMKVCLYMCCHSGFQTIPPLFEPMQCGAALNPPVTGALRDDTGDNISALNREYCELTAHYHAWKNTDADCYGFCHYRRFFALGAQTKYPYIVRAEASPEAALLGTAAQLEALMEKNRIITVRSEDMGLPVREHYCTSAHHYAEDLALFCDILKNTAPQLTAVMEEYLAQTRQYFCNMFIMDRRHFSEYCGILFPALKEFDRRKVRHGCFQADRTDGYLGEVFTGIYITYARKAGASVAEVPRLDAGCSRKKILGCRLLPPETGRRFLAKRAAKKLKKS